MIEFSVDNLGVQPSFVIAFVLSSVKIGDSQGIFVVGERIVSGLFHNFITEWITSRTVLLGSLIGEIPSSYILRVMPKFLS